MDRSQQESSQGLLRQRRRQAQQQRNPPGTQSSSDSKSNSAKAAAAAARSSSTRKQKHQRRQLKGLLTSLAGLCVLTAMVWLVTSHYEDDPEASTMTQSTTRSQTQSSNEKAQAIPDPPDQPLTKFGTYELLETIPHDTTAFTQGLLAIDSSNNDSNNGSSSSSSSSIVLLEGTGMHKASQLRLLDPATGNVLQQQSLPDAFFGEGLAHWRSTTTSNDSSNQVVEEIRILQLTWKEKTAFEYVVATSSTAKNDIKFTVESAPPVANHTYSTTTGEGWGITYGNDQLYVTDGSTYLHTWDPETLTETSKTEVTYRTGSTAAKSISWLNELEFDPATGTILANVLMQDVLLRIDPATGFCPIIYDLGQLYPDRPPSADVFNGIALTYDSTRKNSQDDAIDPSVVWVTGKYWPSMYKIRLIDP